MQEELTVRVEHPELPAIRWNEAEVQQNLTEMLAAYTGRVYTPETIKDAKADRAAVNKLDKQLSDAARSAKAFYMKPLEDFLQSAKQMQGQCKAVSGAIDAQVKAVEEAERQDKQDALPLVRRFYDLGFNIEATKGTAEFLRQHGIRTRTRRKLSEGSTEIIDSLRQGHVSYVINTIDINQHNTRLDGYEIRRTAVENNVTIFTALETVKVLLDVLEEITLGVSTIDAE